MSVFKTSLEPNVHTGTLTASQSTVLKSDSSLEPRFPSLSGLQVFSIPVFGYYSLSFTCDTALMFVTQEPKRCFSCQCSYH